MQGKESSFAHGRLKIGVVMCVFVVCCLDRIG